MGVVVAPLADSTAELADWDRYIDGHADASIYHFSAWRRIFGGTFGYRSWLLAARDGASGRIAGVLPLYLVRAPFARRLVAVPFRDRGGVVWDTPEAFDALIVACKGIADATSSTSIVLKSLAPYPRERTGALGLRESSYWIHSVVNLRGLTPDDLWKSVGDKNRNMVRQAQRSGLRCGPLEATRDSLDLWHRLHVATQKRLGIPPFPRAFFASMSDQLHADGRFALFGVRRGDDLHAAMIVLRHRDTAIYAYSASDATGQHDRANDLMLFEAMRWLLEQHCAVFDLGSDSPRQENLLFFKRKWLAEQKPIPHYLAGRAAAHLDSSHGKYALARKCLSALPAPVFARVGGAITRYFG